MHRSAVVVGLLPRQAQRVADAFPGAGLKFIPRQREREIASLHASFDSVLVMTKFIDHSTKDAIPRDKLIPINGGVSELKAKLTKLLRERSEESVMADYSAIKQAAPGASLHYKRPEGVSQETFESQIKNVRGYYRRQYNISTEQRATPHGVTIVVNGQRPPVLRAVPATPPPAVEATPAETPQAQPKALAAFWSEVYLRFIVASPGAPDDVLMARADAAVAAHRKRFPD